ncbi:purine/pyrimidine permease [Peribacillus alkalitolerans]|uniref:purine/pyrimidine permease n=1 Tax=Peribacillus alkalitolerans TaxID=1550385 RepID=UPI0013D6F2B4|nr:purine/pyrimidine permease [Peribacillus alkalitolerans]
MKTTFSSLQWMAFMFASSIVAPIAVAGLFGLDAAATSSFVQRNMFVMGVAGILQAYFGHRLPINDGPAGIWWGIFTVYAGLSGTLFSSELETLQALQGALIASGVIFILLSVFGLIKPLSKLFTPAVTGVYLLLLVLQLSKSFVIGMLGIGYRQDSIDGKVAMLCFLIVAFTILLSISTKPLLRQYAILLSLAFGWTLFGVFGLTATIPLHSGNMMSFPKVLVFGGPIFDGGLIVASLFVTLLLITNMIASIRIVEQVVQGYGKTTAKNRENYAGMMGGISQIVAGLFSTMGPVPLSGAGGVIQTTKTVSRLPFVLGCCLVILVSLFPAMMNFLSSLPTPVGYSVSFVVFAGMIGLALQDIQRSDNPNLKLSIGISLFIGVGCMFVPVDSFVGLSPIVTAIFSNGLIVGTIAIIIGQQLVSYLDRSSQHEKHKDK